MKIVTIGSDNLVLEKNSRVYNRIKEYASLVDKYFIFVFTSNFSYQKIVDSNFVVVPVYGENKFVQILRLFVLMRRERQDLGKKDVVLSSQDPFEIGLLSYVLSKVFRWRLHLQVHTEFYSKFFKKESLRQRFQSFVARHLLKRVKSIRVVSQKIKDYLVDELGINSDFVIVAPIFIESHASKEDVIKNDNLIVSLSRLEKVKNIFRLISAFEIVASKNSNLLLHIYGDGSERFNIEKRIEDSAFRDQIKMLGFESNPFKVMASARVFAISSDYEGYTVTAVEAVMSGTPVCMTPVGCANEFIVNCINGFVSPTFTTIDFAEILQKTLDYKFEESVLSKSLDRLLSKDDYLGLIKKSWQKAL